MNTCNSTEQQIDLFKSTFSCDRQGNNVRVLVKLHSTHAEYTTLSRDLGELVFGKSEYDQLLSEGITDHIQK